MSSGSTANLKSSDENKDVIFSIGPNIICCVSTPFTILTIPKFPSNMNALYVQISLLEIRDGYNKKKKGITNQKCRRRAHRSSVAQFCSVWVHSYQS